MGNKDSQAAINQRFKEVFEKLKNAGLFKTQREFVEPLKWNQSTLSDVLKNKRPLPLEIAITFCDKYKVNQEWLLYGNGEIFSSETPTAHPVRQLNLADLQKENERLYEIIAIKDKLIDAQKKALAMAEQLLLRSHKTLAHAATPKKN